jgi:hypothetical protein
MFSVGLNLFLRGFGLGNEYGYETEGYKGGYNIA